MAKYKIHKKIAKAISYSPVKRARKETESIKSKTPCLAEKKAPK